MSNHFKKPFPSCQIASGIVTAFTEDLPAMRYDVTTLTVRPGTTPQALARLEQWLLENRLGGKLLTCWYSELGALNQILLIREYAGDTEIATDRDAIVRSSNPYGVADFVTD